MCDPIIGAPLVATLGTAGTAALGAAALQVYQGEKARKAQSQATDRAKRDADMAYNKANPKSPDMASMLASNKRDASGGAGSTLLTGALGVDPNALLLGRQSLLGGAGG